MTYISEPLYEACGLIFVPINMPTTTIFSYNRGFPRLIAYSLPHLPARVSSLNAERPLSLWRRELAFMPLLRRPGRQPFGMVPRQGLFSWVPEPPFAGLAYRGPRRFVLRANSPGPAFAAASNARSMRCAAQPKEGFNDRGAGAEAR